MHEHWNRRYVSNKIKTTRYNVFNFIPITFMLQFTKVINVFYLFNMILQSIPEVTTNDWYFTLMPLSAMVSLGMMKEFIADYKRYKMDKTANGMPTRVLNGLLNKATEDSRQRRSESREQAKRLRQGSAESPGGVNITIDKGSLDLGDHYRLDCEEVRTDELRVGDIIKVMDDEVVPADCFLLASGVSAEDEDANGQCFIATSSLDGERNLKPKMAIKEVEQDFLSLATNSGDDVMMEVKCTDEPIPDLYSFNAELKIVYKNAQ